MSEWQPIETAPKDGTRFKATHSNARLSDQTLDHAANCYWDGSKFQMSCFPLSKCGGYIITAQPNLWQPTPHRSEALPLSKRYAPGVDPAGVRHTPQPWRYGVRRDGSMWLSLGDPTRGPHCQGDLCATEEDARLIVAAPDLLEAAIRILDGGYVSEHIEEERADYLRLRAAIAKATLPTPGGSDGR